jgi:hypothetical protein
MLCSIKLHDSTLWMCDILTLPSYFVECMKLLVLALANLIFILPEWCCFSVLFNPQEQMFTNLALLVTYLHYIQIYQIMKFIIAIMIKLISWMFMNTTIRYWLLVKMPGISAHTTDISWQSELRMGQHSLEHCCALKRLVNSFSVTLMKF